MDVVVRTASEIAKWKRCQKFWWFRYHEELVPVVARKPLSYGKAAHAGLEAYHNGGDVRGAVSGLVCAEESPWSDTESEFVAAEARALLQGYATRDPVIALGHEIVATETTFSVPLRTPSGRRWSGIVLQGKIDMTTRDHQGNLWLWDHKTGASQLKEQWLQINDQMGFYCWAKAELGERPVGIVYDLIRKPSIKPRKEETVADWEARLLADIESRPEFYYQRSEVVKTRKDLDVIGADLWDIAWRIGKGRIHRNPWNCSILGCQYADLCVSDTVLMRSAGYVHKEKHSELKEADE